MGAHVCRGGGVGRVLRVIGMGAGGSEGSGVHAGRSRHDACCLTGVWGGGGLHGDSYVEIHTWAAYHIWAFILVLLSFPCTARLCACRRVPSNECGRAYAAAATDAATAAALLSLLPLLPLLPLLLPCCRCCHCCHCCYGCCRHPPDKCPCYHIMPAGVNSASMVFDARRPPLAPDGSLLYEAEWCRCGCGVVLFFLGGGVQLAA